jgi:group I intron endonuclease
MQGIYIITCSQESIVYIGSSKNIKSRWTKHRQALKRGNHHCNKLQESWDAFGDESFSFSVLEETVTLLIREQYWIDMYWPNCYNTHEKATSYMSEETISKMLETKYAKYGNYSATAILTEDMVLEIIKLINSGESQYSIADKYGISNCAVFNIKAGRSWKHLNHLVTAPVKTQQNLKEKKLLAISKHKDGCSIKDIATLVDRSIRTVQRWIEKN